VTDVEGAYEIRGVPPGRYTMKVWHETLGTLEQQVAVEAGKPVAVDFTFPQPAPETHASR